MDMIQQIESSPHGYVKVAVTDMEGVLRGKYLHKEKFLGALGKGLGFCNVVLGWDIADVCYDNVSYTGWHTGYPDAQVGVDVQSYRVLPWDHNIPFFLADFTAPEGGGLPICPRGLLKRVIENFTQMGLRCVVGPEFEWFNFLETPASLREKHFSNLTPLTPGMFGYSLLRASMNQPFFHAMMHELAQARIPLEGLHTETGPGVLEAAIACTDALEASDRAVLFKTAVKEIGHRFGIMPTFMAKWNAALPGCGGHIHQSVWDVAKGTNVFYDDSHPHKMSAVFEHYLAGQMLCLPDILPMYAPNINSYKRLVEGAWAPTQVTWGVDNRTTAFRVIPGSAQSTRLETRVGGADINPYVATAAALASGLYGIKHRLMLPSKAVQGSGYQVQDAVRLPATLQEATERMAQSSLARGLFGDAWVEHFVNSRRWECRVSQKAVTSWELERYLELV
jgi:glutamine synthetase